MRVTAFAVALWFAPGYAFAGGAEPAASIVEAEGIKRNEADTGRSSLLADCMMLEARGQAHCHQSLRDHQPAGLGGFRGDEPALPFSLVTDDPREFLAPLAPALPRGPALAFSRFILFGNYRS